MQRKVRRIGRDCCKCCIQVGMRCELIKYKTETLSLRKIILKLEVQQPVGPRLPVGSPSGWLFAIGASLTSTFAPFGRSGQKKCFKKTALCFSSSTINFHCFASTTTNSNFLHFFKSNPDFLSQGGPPIVGEERRNCAF